MRGVATLYTKLLWRRERVLARDATRKMQLKWAAIGALPTEALQREALIIDPFVPLHLRVARETPPLAGFHGAEERAREAAAAAVARAAAEAAAAAAATAALSRGDVDGAEAARRALGPAGGKAERGKGGRRAAAFGDDLDLFGAMNAEAGIAAPEEAPPAPKAAPAAGGKGGAGGKKGR
jgi:hypothetical protein